MTLIQRNSFYNFNVFNFFRYFLNLTTKMYHKKSILGATLLLLIIVQCFSGIMLSFYYISEPMLIPFMRNEEDMMDLYNEDFLYIHERLVDYIFICMYLHMYRKISYNVYNKNQINAWVSGATLWLLIHFSIFFGLSLSCTHLSDVTLTIAANIMFTLTFKTGKVYWWIFTNKTLNSDTTSRISYVHYIISLTVLFTSLFHAVEMHYDWKNSILDDSLDTSVSWIYYVSKDEISYLFQILFFFFLISLCIYELNECLSYEIFMWGDVGLINDVRFLGVAPHWYFRAYMGWLIVCPHHYIGVFGLILYLIIIYFQVYIKKYINYLLNYLGITKSAEETVTYFIGYLIFLFCIFYTSSTLPYGKYFNRLEGNLILILSYFFIIIYLTRIYLLLLSVFFWVIKFDVSNMDVFFFKKAFISWLRYFRIVNRINFKTRPYYTYNIPKKKKKFSWDEPKKKQLTDLIWEKWREYRSFYNLYYFF